MSSHWSQQKAPNIRGSDEHPDDSQVNRPLLELFGVDGERPAFFDAEFGQILRWQLDAPLLYDLDAEGLCVTPAAGIPPRIRSFRDALMHPDTSLEVLMLVKEFAKRKRNDGTLPAAIANVLYYLAIAGGLTKYGKYLSGISQFDFGNGLKQIEATEWVESSCKQLIRNTLKLLAAGNDTLKGY